MRDLKLLLFGIIFMFSCRNNEGDEPVAVRDQAKQSAGYKEEITGINTLADTAAVNNWLRKGNAVVDRSPDSAIVMYEEALVLCRYLNYPEGRVIAYNNLTYAYKKVKDFGKANYYRDRLDTALQYIPGPYFNERRHRKLIGQKLTGRAAAFYQSGNYDSAAAWYVQAIEALSPPDAATHNDLAYAYMGLGALSGRLSNKAQALSYFNQAQQLAEQYSDTILSITALSNKATLYVNQGKYDEAEAAAFEALNLSQKKGDLEGRATLANTIAISFINKKKPQEALPYSKMVLEIARKRQSDEELILAYYILGYNYVQLKEYARAEQYLLDGIKMGVSLHRIDNITNGYEQLAEAYEGMGRYQEALAYKKKYTAVKDSLLNAESASRIAETETRYRVAQKDNELASKDRALLKNQLKIASQQKRQYLWTGGALLCILALIGLLMYKQYKAKLVRLRATIEGEEKERRRLARELHDGIVSRLSIIKMNFSALPRQYRNLDEAADFQEVVDQLEQSISELRTTSHNLLPDVLQKAGLCESVNMYCEKIRKTTLLDIEFQLIGALPLLADDFQLNVYRIIQELVNNILKHSNARHTLIQFQAKTDWLSITIDDDGSGMPEDMPEHKGIGMQSLQDRIRLLDGTMEIERGRGTSVYLEFNTRKFIRRK